MDGWLSAVFLGELEARHHAQLAQGSDLEVTLASMIDAGRSALPDVALDAAAFLRHVAISIGETDDDAHHALSSLHVVDVYLACACAHGDAAAIAIVDRDYIAPLAAPLRSTGLDRQTVEDVLQHIREIMLVGTDSVPGIARFRGGGQLRNWLRAVAIRQAMTHFRRRSHGHVGDEALEDVAVSAVGADLAPWKQQFAAAFREAFEHAVKALSEHDRTLLRQHHLDQLTVDELAALHGVHRATAARWIAAARNSLLAHIRDRMRAQLAIEAGDLESALRLARSQLDVSVYRLLGGKRSRK